MNSQHKHVRSTLLAWTAATLAEVSGEVLVGHALETNEWPPRMALVAIGKAAPAMACGAVRSLGRARFPQSLVITRRGYAEPWRSCLRELDAQVIEAGHPVPDERSLAAGAALIGLLERGKADDLLLLISGGASSLVEVLPEAITIDDLRRANTWLLGSGLDIVQVNAVRRRLSRIKGGGLLNWLRGRRTRALALSDVLGDDAAAIGSGLVTAVTDAMSPTGLPDWLVAKLGPSPLAASGCEVDYRILANNRTVCETFARLARSAAVPIILHQAPLTGDARESGECLARQLITAAAGIQIWGGETTVRLPAAPGVGGRNQQLALAAARILDGDRRVSLLALGSDGSDGPTDDAGALVDGGSIERGRLAGLDPLDCLLRADAGRFLEASGDLVTTGPTGTNLNDIVVGWVQDA